MLVTFFRPKRPRKPGKGIPDGPVARLKLPPTLRTPRTHRVPSCAASLPHRVPLWAANPHQQWIEFWSRFSRWSSAVAASPLCGALDKYSITTNRH